MRNLPSLPPLFAAVMVVGCLCESSAADPSPLSFEREILPLLRQACWECHGPEKQEGGLRLDQRLAAQSGGDSGPSWVAGRPDESELLRRVSLPRGDSEIMPARGEPLTPVQLARLRRWIEEGAVWPEQAAAAPHWAYSAPQRPPLPEVRQTEWPQTAVDTFLLARLEQEQLAPAAIAERAVLIRRLSLDLTGLPPAPEHVAAFVSDPRPDAYDRLADRLFASPQFGVRWARPWLDYARYADSHGFQRDDFRDLWAYRDWVVDALNSDLPFDQFTIEQLAGDLLPGATESQRIATGFNRSSPCNVEAGSDPEETRVNQVFDRVNTLGMVWLGTTLECCQCHDHKYDPFTQRDYYRLFAFFNNTSLEADRSNPKVPGSIRFLGPEMPLTDDRVEAARNPLAARLKQVESELAARKRELQVPDSAWEADLRQLLQDAPREHVLEPLEFESQGGATHEVLPDRSVLLSGETPDRDTYTLSVITRLEGIRGFKLEALTDDSLPGQGPGRGDAQRPNFVLNTFAVELLPLAGGPSQAVTWKDARADYSQPRFAVAGAIDDDEKTAWAIHPQFHQPHWAVFETAAPAGSPEGLRLRFTLVQNYGGGRTLGRFRISALTGRLGTMSLPDGVVVALETPAQSRTQEQHAALAAYRLAQDPALRELQDERARVQAQLAALQPPTTLVMQELPEPRAAALFRRGDFRSPAEGVEPGVPASLHPLEDFPAGSNRLTLARWLVRRDNPLVARVTVNRWWAELFGQGLVTTPEDFGIKGEPPTHPELLDQLAVHFMDEGWSMKRSLRPIVLSASYRQTAAVSPALLARDDQNRLYARGPSFRLDAEAIRDNALAIAGLLSWRQAGKPIQPYQPDGIWVKVGGQRYDYVVSPGEDKYRRGLYVIWKRGAPYPSFVNFDANSRMACRVQRPRSNTPLQALTLMNDPVYVEAALAFARRILDETPSPALEDRLTYAWRIALSRAPQPEELAVLRELYSEQFAASGADETRAATFIAETAPPAGVSTAEFVAWYAVAAALLNLDETISK